MSELTSKKKLSDKDLANLVRAYEMNGTMARALFGDLVRDCLRELQDLRSTHEPPVEQPPSAFAGVSMQVLEWPELEPVVGRVTELETALRELMRGYVSTLETARERILFYGGQCDDVPTMERGDPHLRKARATLTKGGE